MILKKLILKNFRVHRDLELDFTEGLVGVCGRNGTGKSSVIEAILFNSRGIHYGSTKEELLTLGTTGGYVIGHWEHDGVKIVLERHIDSPKVFLKYGDKPVLKKSGEVNELWNSLFQIDDNLMKSVVVSSQGEIALLFNGDNAVKEKLFQKIFMVPPTEKLRKLIWDYLKAAPPEYPVKDLDTLTSDCQIVEELIRLDQQSLDAIFISEEGYQDAIARMKFLRSVADSSARVAALDREVTNQAAAVATHKADLAAIDHKLASINIADAQQYLAELEVARGQLEAKQKAQAALAGIVCPLTSEQVAVIPQLPQYEAHASGIYGELSASRSSVMKLENQRREYKQSGLSSGVCPTCGTKVDSVVQLLAHVEAELAPLTSKIQSLEASYAEAQQAVNTLAQYKTLNEGYERKLAAAKANLSAYESLTIEYSPEDHQLYTKVVATYKELQHKRKVAEQQVQWAEQTLNNTKLQLASVPQYDKPQNQYDEEVQHLGETIQFFNKQIEERQQLQVSIKVRKNELNSLIEDLALNKGYIEKNAVRKSYVAVLEQAYDVLHTTKFARALIQTYATTVNEYMDRVLASFDFPYTAKVNEAFGIDVYTEDGLKLPCVSGGQQVMIGFSLRLALHNMFAGSFPFMIVDEGSYGLAEDAAQKYFEIIEQLGQTKQFKQVIVIDHHKELGDYVDTTITLKALHVDD